MELPSGTADKTNMMSPSIDVLCFVLAMVLGYFAGRTKGILERARSRED